MTTQLESTISEALDGKRLDQALAVLFPDYSRSRLKEWILAGQYFVMSAMTRFQITVMT